MHAHKIQITIPENHGGEISFPLPDDFPSGSAEVIVLSNSQNKTTTQSSQSIAAALKELPSFQRTPEEEKVLDDFESFQGEHPFSLKGSTVTPESSSPESIRKQALGHRHGSAKSTI